MKIWQWAILIGVMASAFGLGGNLVGNRTGWAAFFGTLLVVLIVEAIWLGYREKAQRRG